MGIAAGLLSVWLRPSASRSENADLPAWASSFLGGKDARDSNEIGLPVPANPTGGGGALLPSMAATAAGWWRVGVLGRGVCGTANG